jgi:phosphoserine phosphatase
MTEDASIVTTLTEMTGYSPALGPERRVLRPRPHAHQRLERVRAGYRRLARQARPKHQFVRDAGSAVAFKFTGASDETSEGVRDRILGAVKGIRLDDLVGLNADIVPKLMAKVRPEALRNCSSMHRHAGRATYIVSASPIELVEPLAKALGMTGRHRHSQRHRRRRVHRRTRRPVLLRPRARWKPSSELARWEGLDLDQCWAYSDSASDLPMLEAVGHPVAVNPDAKLERVAGQRGWPIVVFSKRTKAVIRRTTQGVGAVGLARRVASPAAFAGPHPVEVGAARSRPAASGRSGGSGRPACRSSPTPRRPRSKKPPCTNRLRNTHCTGPGAGTARTCTVSSTVGTQPGGMSRWNTAGGNASHTAAAPACRADGRRRSRTSRPSPPHRCARRAPNRHGRGGCRTESRSIIATSAGAWRRLRGTHSSNGGSSGGAPAIARRSGARRSTTDRRTSRPPAAWWRPSGAICPVTVVNRRPAFTTWPVHLHGPGRPGDR